MNDTFCVYETVSVGIIASILVPTLAFIIFSKLASIFTDDYPLVVGLISVLWVFFGIGKFELESGTEHIPHIIFFILPFTIVFGGIILIGAYAGDKEENVKSNSKKKS